MQTEYYDLEYWQVLVAALLVLINGTISVLFQLKLEKQLLWASIRTVVQLIFIGLILESVFRSSHWTAIVGIMLVMSVIAGSSAMNRIKTQYKGLLWNSLVAVMASSWIITTIALTAILQPAVWSETPAQYAIPLLGMILGNTLNGISLGMDRFTSELKSKRNEIEMLLTLGSTRQQAAKEPLREALRTGMIPIINSMMMVGLVSIPGMMTGQMLSGVSPMAAVKYQIVIMFLIAAGTSLGTIIAILLGYRKLFNQRHQFLYYKLN